MIVLLFKTAGGIKQLDFFYQTDHGISVSKPECYIIFYGVIILIVVLSFTTGRRSFCHYGCWMSPFMIIGTKIKNFINYPSLNLIADQDKCINCKSCTKKCPMSLEVMDMVHQKSMTNSECILCGECVDVCPKSVIKYAIKRK